MSAETLADMKAVVNRYPYAPAMSELAYALALNGRVDEASKLFTKIQLVHGPAIYAVQLKALRVRTEGGSTAMRAWEASLPTELPQ